MKKYLHINRIVGLYFEDICYDIVVANNSWFLLECVQHQSYQSYIITIIIGIQSYLVGSY